jgi:hypothetical protein
MDHAQLTMDKSLNDMDWIAGHAVSGHALMATAIPIEYVREHGMEEKYSHQLPEMAKPDLSRMLNLCAKLPGLSGEVTPVMAWSLILQHPRAVELTEVDVENIKADLKNKVACFGYVFVDVLHIDLS